MTTSPGDAPASVTIIAAWPQTANAGARVTNVNAYQWDQSHAGVYLMMGHLGFPPLWVAPGDRERWEQDRPDNRIAVEPLGAFYMTETVAKDFCKGFAKYLGLTVVEEDPVPPVELAPPAAAGDTAFHAAAIGRQLPGGVRPNRPGNSAAGFLRRHAVRGVTAGRRSQGDKELVDYAQKARQRIAELKERRHSQNPQQSYRRSPAPPFP